MAGWVCVNVCFCLIGLELIQTELHHVRTLRIMDGVFRRGMLDEVQLEPGVVHALFPCLEKLLVIHTRFLTQLLNRRQHCLQLDSTHNFTISRISDLLLQQVAYYYYLLVI